MPCLAKRIPDLFGSAYTLSVMLCIGAMACSGLGSEPAPAKFVSLEAATIWVPIGAERNVIATAKDATGAPTTAEITWESSDPAVATVNNGVVRSRKYGLATLKASVSGVPPATAVIAVLPPAGTYDLTTVLTSYSDEGEGPPDCPNGRCTVTIADTGATLFGTLVVSTAGIEGALGGTYCGGTGGTPSRCQGHVPVAAMNYIISSFFPESSGHFHADLQGSTGSSVLYGIGLITDSSSSVLAGSVTWTQGTFRIPPYMSGTFVARRRP